MAESSGLTLQLHFRRQARFGLRLFGQGRRVAQDWIAQRKIRIQPVVEGRMKGQRLAKWLMS